MTTPATRNVVVIDLTLFSQEERDIFTKLADASFGGLGSGGLPFLRVRKTGFAVTGLGEDEIIPFNACYCIFLGASPVNHAVWYRNTYQPGQNDQPDLIWKFPNFETFPDALPKQFREKQARPGFSRPVWGFSIRRRTVWALIRPKDGNTTYIDYENPVVFDIPSASMFGKSTVAGCYHWGEIAGLCRAASRNGVAVYPGMFITQIVVDSTGPQGTVLFKPGMKEQGLSLMPIDEIRRAVSYATSEKVRDMVDIREKLTYEDGGVQYATQPAAQPVKSQPAPAASPAPKSEPVSQPSTPAQPAQAAQPEPAVAAPKEEPQNESAADLLQQAVSAMNSAKSAGQASEADNMAQLTSMFGA